MVLRSKKIFDFIAVESDKQGGFPADVLKKVNGVYEFHLYKKFGGPITKWTVDLKNKGGRTALSDLKWGSSLAGTR